MRTLLDTCVLSEILRPQGAERVKLRVGAIADDDLFVSAITIGEIAKGVALAEPGQKRERYAQYLASMVRDFENRVIPVDAEVAQIWGKMAALHRQEGRALSVPDGLIAACAVRHGLQVMTSNIKDFEGTGAMLVNPWEDA